MSFPIGTVVTYSVDTPPADYLECDGSEISRTTFAALFAVISDDWGVGDGATTFLIPDERGKIARGLDSGRGVDSGRAIGTNQAYANKSHNHTYQNTNSLIAASTQRRGGLQTTLVSTNSTGGSENRPFNISALRCIKYQ